MDTSTILDMRNRITPEDLEAIVRSNLEIIAENPELSATLPPLMVWGGPGVGKSTILRKVAEALGIGFIDIRLAQREPVDIRGLPVPDENSVRWLISSDWPRDPTSRGILLFDELTAADRSLQVAAYEIILDRRLGDLYQLPKGWYIVAAGNREEDMAVATTMSSALANRFMHVELQESPAEWVKWGLQNGVHPAVIGFIRFRPDLLFHQENENLERGWPTPRAPANFVSSCAPKGPPPRPLPQDCKLLDGTRTAVPKALLATRVPPHSRGCAAGKPRRRRLKIDHRRQNLTMPSAASAMEPVIYSTIRKKSANLTGGNEIFRKSLLRSSPQSAAPFRA